MRELQDRLGITHREMAFVASRQVPLGATLSEGIAAVLRMTDEEILAELSAIREDWSRP